MKKRYWAMPVIVVLLSAAAYLYVKNKEIDPMAMVLESESGGPAEITEAQAVTLLENDIESFIAALEGGALPENVLRLGEGKFIIGEKAGSFTQYFYYGGAGDTLSSLGAMGYNKAQYRRELPGGWTYCLDYIKPVTYADRYREQAGEYLTAEQKSRIRIPLEECELVLIDREYASIPAKKKTGASVAELKIPADGGNILAYFDLKTKNIVWIEDGIRPGA